MFNFLENLLRPKAKPGLVGIWLDEQKMLAAARSARQEGCRKFDAITPLSPPRSG